MTKSKSLQQIEEEHGFRFGLPDDVEHTSNGAPILKHVKCATVGCDRARPEHPPLPIHEDTVQPVFCGGCGEVLHCDHVPAEKDEDEITGTLLQPVLISRRRCRTCKTVLHEKRVEQKPVAFEDLPASLLAGLGASFTPKSEG